MYKGPSGGWTSFDTHARGGYPASDQCEGCAYFDKKGSLWQEYGCNHKQGNTPGYAVDIQISKGRIGGLTGDVSPVHLAKCSQFKSGGSTVKQTSSGGGGFGASGGKNIIGGLGQMLNPQSVDDLVFGPAKVGLGAAKLLGKGLIGGAKLLKESGEKSREKAKEKEVVASAADEELVDTYMQHISSCMVTGDNTLIIQSLSDLLSIIAWESDYSSENQDIRTECCWR